MLECYYVKKFLPLAQTALHIPGIASADPRATSSSSLSHLAVDLRAAALAAYNVFGQSLIQKALCNLLRYYSCNVKLIFYLGKFR